MTEWTARVEWSSPDLSDDQLEDLAQALTDDGSHGAVGGEREPGRWSATVTVDARTLLRASDTAIGRVRAALRQVLGDTEAPLTGVEVLDTTTFDARSEQPVIPELVTRAEIARLLQVSPQRIGQLAEQTGFPREAVRTTAGPLWARHQVQDWAASWQRRPGRPAAVTRPST